MLRDAANLVLVLGRPGDVVASTLAEVLGRHGFELRREDVDGPGAVRDAVRGAGAALGVVVVGASEPTSASTLVWDLDKDPRGLAERTVVVVDEEAKLDAVPPRLIDALTYLALDDLSAASKAGSRDPLERLADLVREVLERPRGEIDVLASLVRSAIDRRSIESLAPLRGDWAQLEALEPEHLILAHLGDGGRPVNPLWAAWTWARRGPALSRLRAQLQPPAPRAGEKARPLRAK